MGCLKLPEREIWLLPERRVERVRNGFARFRGIQADRRDIKNFAIGSAFNGNFASLFSGVLQSVQTDLGLTYGSTMLDAGGIGPVVTITGSLSTTPVPILLKCTLAGALGVWTYAVYYDGGTTPAMTGTSASTIALTGAGTGLTLNLAAGVAVLNNTWTATCAGLADQSGNGFAYSQVTSATQPKLAVGLNGFAKLSFDGVVNTMVSASGPNLIEPCCLLAVVAPGAFTSGINTIFNANTTGTNAQFIDITATNVRSLSGNVISGTYTVGAMARMRADYSNSAGDILRIGANQVTGNAGAATAAAGRSIGASNGLRFGTLNLLTLLYLNHIPSVAEMAAFDAAVTSKYGGSVAL